MAEPPQRLDQRMIAKTRATEKTSSAGS